MQTRRKERHHGTEPDPRIPRGPFQKNAPITDEVFSALKECLKPRNLDTNDYVSGETVRIRAAIDSLGFRHGKNLNAYVEYQENEGEAPFVFLTIESEDGHFSSRHSKLTFKINETGYANAILECSSRNGEDWYAYEIPTMLGVGAAYYALLSWEAYQGIKTGRLEAVVPEDDWNSYLEDYPEVETTSAQRKNASPRRSCSWPRTPKKPATRTTKRGTSERHLPTAHRQGNVARIPAPGPLGPGRARHRPPHSLGEHLHGRPARH